MLEVGNHPIFKLYLSGGREIRIYYNGVVEGCDDLVGIANHIDFLPICLAPMIPGETARDRYLRVCLPYKRYFSKSHAVSGSPTLNSSGSSVSEGAFDSSARSMESALSHSADATGEK